MVTTPINPATIIFFLLVLAMLQSPQTSLAQTSLCLLNFTILNKFLSVARSNSSLLPGDASTHCTYAACPPTSPSPILEDLLPFPVPSQLLRLLLIGLLGPSRWLRPPSAALQGWGGGQVLELLSTC